MRCEHCIRCLDEEWEEFGEDRDVFPPSAKFMVLCEHCGNKRCPHATNCDYECTGSNEPNQEGSVYQYG